MRNEIAMWEELRRRAEKVDLRSQELRLRSFSRDFPFKLDALLIDVRRGIYPFEHASLGMIYISSYLEAHGMKTAIIPSCDAEGAMNGRALREILSKHSPKVIGISVSSITRHFVILLAHQIKNYDPSIVTVIGGPEVSAEAQNILKEDLDRAIDYAVRGEGEEVFHQICQKFCENRGDLESIEGLVYRRGEEIIDTGKIAKIEDIDSLPNPDFRIACMTDIPSLPLITARGCAYSCRFCFEGGQSRLRQSGVQKVVDEWKRLCSYPSIKSLTILDDALTTDVDRLHKILAGINGFAQIPWFCEGRADVLADNPDLLKEMVDAGLCRLQIGFESGSQRVLDAYNKGVTTDDIFKAVRASFNAGVRSIFGNFILGGAFEDEGTIEETIDFAKTLMDIAPWSVEIASCFFAPHPGTEITREPESYEVQLIDPWLHAVNWQAFCVNRTVHLERRDIVRKKIDFDDAVRRKMLEQINTIPLSIALLHLRSFYNSQFSTSWGKLIRISIHTKLFVSASRWIGDRLVISDTSPSFDGMDWTRLTIISLVSPQSLIIKDGKIIIEVRWDIKRPMSPLDQFILFTSDGSRTIADQHSLSIEMGFENREHSSSYKDLFWDSIRRLADDFAVAIIRL